MKGSYIELCCMTSTALNCNDQEVLCLHTTRGILCLDIDKWHHNSMCALQVPCKPGRVSFRPSQYKPKQVTLQLRQQHQQQLAEQGAQAVSSPRPPPCRPLLTLPSVPPRPHAPQLLVSCVSVTILRVHCGSIVLSRVCCVLTPQCVKYRNSVA